MNEEQPIKKYECLNCKAIITLPVDSEKKITCCHDPKLKLLLIQHEHEEGPKIELGKCYEGIIDILRNYLDMPEDYYKLISIWIIGTYFHEKFSSYPFIFFNAMRGSGKTRTLKLISSLGSKGDGSVQNNITESVLFRIPEGTITCIDECERIGSKEKSTLRELLNAAYKKGTKVKRMKKVRIGGEEKFVTEEFEPYIPIAMANIKGLEEVLEDRALTLILEKSNNPLKTKKIEDFQQNPKISDIKRTLTQFSVVYAVSLCYKIINKWNDYIDVKYTNNTYNTHTHTTQTTQQTTPQDIMDEELFNKIDDAGVDGRNFELLFPLLVMANELEDKIFEDILRIGKEIIDLKKKDEESESIDVSVIEFVSMQENLRFQYTPIKNLLISFRVFLGETDSEDSWLNVKWFGRALKRLNLIGDKRRMAGGRQVILNVDKAREKIKMFKREKENE